MSNHKTTQFIQAIYREQNGRLVRFLRNMLHSREEAEDIAQDAFFNLMRSGEPEKLEHSRSYLFQTAYNLALNRMRKQRRHLDYLRKVNGQDDSDAGLDVGAERTVAARQELDRVMAALNELPAKVRRAFLLSRGDHKTYPEISRELGVSVSSVEKYLIRALDHLRRVIDNNQ